MASLLNGKQSSDTTLVYIVNALNGEIKQVNTLATQAGQAAMENMDAIDGVRLIAIQTGQEFAAYQQTMSWQNVSQYVESQIADLYTQDGDLIAKGVPVMQAISALSQNANQIQLSFEQSLASYAQQLGEVRSDVNTVSTYITADISGLWIQSSNSPAKILLANDGMKLYVNNTVVAQWEAGGQVGTSMLSIDNGGAMSLGDNFRVAVRSAGNVSIVYTGA